MSIHTFHTAGRSIILITPNVDDYTSVIFPGIALGIVRFGRSIAIGFIYKCNCHCQGLQYAFQYQKQEIDNEF